MLIYKKRKQSNETEKKLDGQTETQVESKTKKKLEDNIKRQHERDRISNEYLSTFICNQSIGQQQINVLYIVGVENSKRNVSLMINVFVCFTIGPLLTNHNI